MCTAPSFIAHLAAGGKIMSLFRGSGVALVTPFIGNEVNFEALGALIDYQLKNGTQALIACGTTGEPSTMTPAERASVIGFTVKRAAGRVPVIAGIGCNSTATTVVNAKEAAALGADALLVVTPYYNKCTQGGLIAHYTAVADATELPVIMYNVPGRTGLNMLPATVKALSKHPRIIAVKEACGNIQQISDTAMLCGDDIDIYSGDDGIVLPILSLGGIGVISVAANIAPHGMQELCEKYFKRDIAGARAEQFRLNPLVAALFSEVSPIPVKAALNMLGIAAGEPRLPLTPAEDKTKAQLKAAMTAYGLQVRD